MKNIIKYFIMHTLVGEKFKFKREVRTSFSFNFFPEFLNSFINKKVKLFKIILIN